MVKRALIVTLFAYFSFCCFGLKRGSAACIGWRFEIPDTLGIFGVWVVRFFVYS